MASREQRAFAINVQDGIYLEFNSEPGFDLKFDSLGFTPSGIELLNVRQIEKTTLATCFIPDGKLIHFVKKVSEYLQKDTEKGKPRNQKLIESISDIRKAAIEALWTDDISNFPSHDEAIWWEIWLRSGNGRQNTLEFFFEHGSRIGLEILQKYIIFPERTVVVAHGTKEQMSRSLNLLNIIAELRRPKETADFFTSLTSIEQLEWVDDSLERLSGLPPDNLAICILDTGVNNQHPLLKVALDDQDMHTVEPAWNVADHKGHGTLMAGLGLYGDLTELFTSSQPFQLGHRLESVKILPPYGDNPPLLYGAITAEGIGRVEIAAPNRQRVFCMAVTTTDFRDLGKPSSWSARLDALASGADDNEQRLIIIAAGNTSSEARHLYPDSNQTDGIHDPGQSWNALTVGAFTQKNTIDGGQYPGWYTVAPPGDLSPSSCTSLIWSKPWPIKPDVVLEGGNMAINPEHGMADYLDSLSLLSTYWKFTIKPLDIIHETSAATALASRMAIMLQSQYPDFWPETIRGLLIHSAKWTEAMRVRFVPTNKRGNLEKLLRYCGYGVPNFSEAMWSAQNSLTLIAQDSLQPFDKEENQIKSRDMNIHAIPWPIEVLEDLGETEVEMKITLSYFIEPNPGARGWSRKYSYASHGLRFEAKKSLETMDQFRGRINRLARDEESGIKSTSDAKKWVLGPTLRKHGSIHSDTWKGTAAELAQRGFIAVYPVVGWWRERPKLERWNKRARYSLIVSIRAPEADIDIYTPVLNLIETAIPLTG